MNKKKFFILVNIIIHTCKYQYFLIKYKNSKTLPVGLEPTTYRLTADRYYQLSYRRIYDQYIFENACL